MLFSCCFAVDSLNPSQLTSHFFRHNLISAEISHLEPFPWDFSKTSSDSFDYRSDLCYHDCQVSMQLFKRTRISTWFFYSCFGLGRHPLPHHPTHTWHLLLHSNGKGRNEVNSGLAGVRMTQIQGQVPYSFLVYNWSDKASQMSKHSRSIWCTSSTLPDFIHSTSTAEINLWPGTVLGSGDTAMKMMHREGVMRSEECFWLP